jgi:RNA polymerase sigma-70 factor (ECF subfamily)
MLQSDVTNASPHSLEFFADECAYQFNAEHAVGQSVTGRAAEAKMQSCPALALCSGQQRQLSDDDLIKRIAGRDTAAMHSLYVRYRTKVFNFIHRRMRERHNVEDLVSQVFLDVWHAADTFKHRSRVSTWLLSIARFKALQHFRRNRRERIDNVDVFEMIDHAEPPEVMIDRMKMNDLLRSCVRKLHPARRKVIDLVYYQERSVVEASEILGIPRSTVKTRMFYARKELATLLEAAGLDRAAFHQLGAPPAQ